MVGYRRGDLLTDFILISIYRELKFFPCPTGVLRAPDLGVQLTHEANAHVWMKPVVADLAVPE